MTREDIIRMAREAGIVSAAYDAGFMDIFTLKLERFFHLAAAAEREACAKVCREWVTAEDCATAIRARGEK